MEYHLNSQYVLVLYYAYTQLPLNSQLIHIMLVHQHYWQMEVASLGLVM